MAAIALSVLTGGVLAPASASAAAPTIAEVWASSVFSTSARIAAQINPNSLPTSYHLDYIPRATYEANVAGGKDPFAGALRSPASSEANVGSGATLIATQQQPFGLAPDTAYRYRLLAQNSTGTTTGPTLTFATQAAGGAPLPDNRGWEMVSPVDKNGGQVDPPGALAGGGVPQAATNGQSVAYVSSTSFGQGAAGAATASQYLATRVGGGWSTQNITTPLYSASYNTQSEGVPYRLFSTDLARGLLLNGRHCRGEGGDCAVPNPPLTGTDAPVGYQNYYLLEGGAFTALLGSGNAADLALAPEDFELGLAGAAPDLRHAVLSTCAALTPNATEMPLAQGCDPAQPNLYAYAPGMGLALVNLLPAQGTGTPGATLAAQSGAISADASRIYFSLAGDLYLRESAQTKAVDATLGGGGSFQAASVDGSVAYFTKAGHLYRYQAAGAGSVADLTIGGGVTGVLGASGDGASVYYQDGSALKLWHGGTTTVVAAGAAAAASNHPPATGTSRVSADGTELLFVSTQSLTGYDNEDLNTGLPDSQVYLYDASAAGALTCVSCNPTFGRPIGPSAIPGALANGTAPGSPHAYKPRALSADGRRVFFDSADAIGLADTNGKPDVYQWEAQGTGSCARPGGCISLLSGGKAPGGASFVDASADGADAFLLTDGSLVSSDPGALDLYDARVDGGFPVAQVPLPCFGDACQPLPSAPTDPTLTTLLSGPGNPAVRYPGNPKSCKKGYRKRGGKCVKKKSGREKKRRQSGGRR